MARQNYNVIRQIVSNIFRNFYESLDTSVAIETGKIFYRGLSRWF